MQLEDIKIREINVFLELTRTMSVRALARERNTNPGQISKIISSLENKIGHRLVERSSLGIKLTAEARELLPMLTEIYKNQEALQTNFGADKESPILSFATTSFFSTHLVPALFADLHKKYPNFKLRLLDLPPDLFMPVAMRNGFQVCLHLRELDWPKTWTSEKVGELQWVLCCRKGHPLLDNDTLNLNAVVKFPFVFPVYWANDGITYGNDNFPVTTGKTDKADKTDKRIRGIETSTATSAIEIVRLSDHLGFVPELVARSLINSGKLVQINLAAIKPVRQPIYLSVKSDKITQRMYHWLIETSGRRLQMTDSK